jgi:hypothetical protein
MTLILGETIENSPEEVADDDLRWTAVDDLCDDDVTDDAVVVVAASPPLRVVLSDRREPWNGRWAPRSPAMTEEATLEFRPGADSINQLFSS